MRKRKSRPPRYPDDDTERKYRDRKEELDRMDRDPYSYLTQEEFMREQEKEREENAGRRPQSVDAGGSLAQNGEMDDFSNRYLTRELARLREILGQGEWNENNPRLQKYIEQNRGRGESFADSASRARNLFEKGPGSMNDIDELLRMQPNTPARRVITPEVMPRGGGMPGMGGPAPRLPNMAIPTTGGTLPPAVAGASMLPMAGMVGAGMLIPSMIGGQTGPEAARGQIDRLATQQGRVLPSPGFSQEETNAMIDSVLQGPSKRPKMELYGAMEPGSDPELEMARMKSVKDSNPAKSPAPMDDGAIDELIGFGGKSTTPTESAMRSKVMPTDDSILTDVVGGGLPKKTYRVKGASSGEEADSAASAADFVDRGRKKGINTYSGKKKKRKYDLLEE